MASVSRGQTAAALALQWIFVSGNGLTSKSAPLILIALRRDIRYLSGSLWNQGDVNASFSVHGY
jgi:hypothetical protein